MTQRGFPKYRRGQRAKTAVDLVNDHAIRDTQPKEPCSSPQRPARSSTSRSIPKRTCRSTLPIVVNSCIFEWRRSP